MLPQAPKKDDENSTRTNFLVATLVHIGIVAVLVFFAARQGYLGQQLQRITVQIVKEKPPEKAKEPETPKPEPPKVETPKPVEIPKTEVAKAAPPPAAVAAPPPPFAPAAAPPPADVPSLVFDGGAPVQTSSDPVLLYKNAVERAFLSRWQRPNGMADDDYVDEVEITVDHSGKISDPVWVKTSGNDRWDASVRQAVAQTSRLDRPPPAEFPARFVVRFDVAETSESILQTP